MLRRITGIGLLPALVMTSVEAQPVFTRLGAGGSLPQDPMIVLEEARLTAGDPSSYAWFGQDVAIDGDTCIVSAPGWLFGRGAVYVLERTGGVWTQTDVLTADDASSEDRFGSSICIDGDRIAIGASQADHLGTYSQSGAVYVFVRSGTGWTQEIKLVPSDIAAGDYFGFDVALEGDTLVVGSLFDSTTVGTATGSAYVFRRGASGWSQEAKLLPASVFAQGHERFGPVDLSGSRVVVGAFGDNIWGPGSGAVYVFERVGSSWSLTQLLSPEVGAPHEAFGYAVSLDGDRLAIGAHETDGPQVADVGAAYVFEYDGAWWNQVAKLTAGDALGYDQFGRALDLQADLLVVGSTDHGHGSSRYGAAFLFTRDDTGWSEQVEFQPSSVAAWSGFSGALGIDQGTVLAGAFKSTTSALTQAGSAFVFSTLQVAVPYCFCLSGPCNNSSPDAGCLNSSGMGALLSVAAGTGRVALDDLVLVAEGLPTHQFGLVFMGGAQTSAVFGNGLRCVTGGATGTFRYLPPQTSGGGGSFNVGPGLLSYGQAHFDAQGLIQPGESWFFQAWFRDPAGPCGSSFNLSNGLKLTFMP